jgi:hypothetical protein
MKRPVFGSSAMLSPKNLVSEAKVVPNNRSNAAGAHIVITGAMITDFLVTREMFLATCLLYSWSKRVDLWIASLLSFIFS